ncbi:unnamed protein product [Cyprideis torosa]|uniref:Uncharacterized protein n=1 Tax=Cyprideis torosa TaxID=163714 RepID=A0A7R8WBI6_9CRUS|nr:unnamed protein product [Cyprideis torosa]CAG0886966.1 unnamed protein product [Cyprideis torosa]
MTWVRKSLKLKAGNSGASAKMDKLRRSFRDSFRKKKDTTHQVTEASRPHQWAQDELDVRAGNAVFLVRYLGCIEVFESRGMSVCEEALKHLRQNIRRRPVKGNLYVSGDGLRVVDDETKGLIVDQTIEKVSFCAPDRNHERGFSYICRDGTSRRWMCHGFLAIRDSGERLSHAVGCAFAVCLERKQKREKECGVTMNVDKENHSFTRTGSFRTVSLTERIQDPQECKPAEPPPVKNVVNPHAIERPHATPSLLLRQGSFRGFSALNQVSPFKRQLSLRLSELPSTLERAQEMAKGSLSSSGDAGRDQTEFPPPPEKRSFGVTLFSDPLTPPDVAPIPEVSPSVPTPPLSSSIPDPVSVLAQEVSQGLNMLTQMDFGKEPSSVPPRSQASRGQMWTSKGGSVSVDVANPFDGKSPAPRVAPPTSEAPWVDSNQDSGLSTDSNSSREINWLVKKAPGLKVGDRSKSLDEHFDPFDAGWVNEWEVKNGATSATPTPIPGTETTSVVLSPSHSLSSAQPSQIDTDWKPTNPFAAEANVHKAFEVHL